eukprot:101944-Amphidinium_carterae.3
MCDRNGATGAVHSKALKCFSLPTWVWSGLATRLPGQCVCARISDLEALIESSTATAVHIASSGRQL